MPECHDLSPGPLPVEPVEAQIMSAWETAMVAIDRLQIFAQGDDPDAALARTMLDRIIAAAAPTEPPPS
jgi:hypothetical protein